LADWCTSQATMCQRRQSQCEKDLQAHYAEGHYFNPTKTAPRLDERLKRGIEGCKKRRNTGVTSQRRIPIKLQLLVSRNASRAWNFLELADAPNQSACPFCTDFLGRLFDTLRQRECRVRFWSLIASEATHRTQASSSR
jgi:hypothetical protein